MKHAVKLISEAADAYTVGGYGMVWGGADLRGERFEPDTDLWFDRLTETPMVLYEHGFDRGTQKTVLGKVVSKTVDDIGLWIEAQIETASEYADAVRELVKKGVLGWSSGAVQHLCEIDGTGKITSWPVAEFSLTPDPCEPRTVGVAELATLSESAPSVKALVDRVKALPADPTPVNGKGSYEDLTRTLDRAVSKMLCEPGDWDCWSYVTATYPGYVVAALCEDSGTRFFEITYKLKDGVPVLGESREVAPAYLPIETPPAEMAATAVLSAYTVRSATALAARVRVLHEGRVKEGRVLSPANRDRLKANRDALAGLVDTYTALLTETEPKTSAEAGAANAVVEVQAAYARILATACGVEVPS